MLSKGCDVSDWMTLRVVLAGRVDDPLPQPPGRILLVHSEHTFADVAEAIDAAFARWDLQPEHQFEVAGRGLSSQSEDASDDVEASEDVQLGDVDLDAGTRFSYVFDLDEEWTHQCTLEEVDVDPYEVADDEPDYPLAVFGWGTVPDQYGRTEEHDEEGEDTGPTAVVRMGDVDAADDLDTWDAAESGAWRVVQRAIAGEDRPADPAAVSRAVASVRALRLDQGSAAAAVWSAAGADEGHLPPDDTRVWLELTAAVVTPRDDVQLDAEALAALASLEPADWAGAVIELVRAGVGTAVTPEGLVVFVTRCPEIEGEDLTREDQAVLVEGFTVAIDLWTALGAVVDERLTPLGLWGLPEALRVAWDD